MPDGTGVRAGVIFRLALALTPEARECGGMKADEKVGDMIADWGGF